MTVCCTNPYSRLKAAPSFIEVILAKTNNDNKKKCFTICTFPLVTYFTLGTEVKMA